LNALIWIRNDVLDRRIMGFEISTVGFIIQVNISNDMRKPRERERESNRIFGKNFTLLYQSCGRTYFQK
jgi:hypothetical protein